MDLSQKLHSLLPKFDLSEREMFAELLVQSQLVSEHDNRITLLIRIGVDHENIEFLVATTRTFAHLLIYRLYKAGQILALRRLCQLVSAEVGEAYSTEVAQLRIVLFETETANTTLPRPVALTSEPFIRAIEEDISMNRRRYFRLPQMDEASRQAFFQGESTPSINVIAVLYFSDTLVRFENFRNQLEELCNQDLLTLNLRNEIQVEPIKNLLEGIQNLCNDVINLFEVGLNADPNHTWGFFLSRKLNRLTELSKKAKTGLMTAIPNGSLNIIQKRGFEDLYRSVEELMEQMLDFNQYLQTVSLPPDLGD